MLKLFAKFVSRNTKLVVLICTLLIIPCIYGAVSTKINYDVLSYLPEDKESVIGENIIEDKFKMAATTFLIIDDMPDNDIKKLKKKIEKIPAVNKVIYLRDAIGIGVPVDFLPKEVKDNFYKGDSQLLLIKYEEKAASDSTMDAITEMKKLLSKQSYISGLSILLRDIKMLILKEMPIYELLAGILSLIVLLFCLESWVLPFIFMLTIGLGIIYNFGTNIFLGEISYITQAIAAILQLAVTMDYAIFVVHRYEEEKKTTPDKKDAMAKSIMAAFVSLAGSSLTTVAGFGALCFMGFTLGKDLGIVMMKGVVLGVITCITFLPAMILIFDNPIEKYQHKVYMPNLHKFTEHTIKNRKKVLLIFLIAFIPSFYFQANVPIYYDISRSLPSTIDANIGKNKLEETFDMSTSHIIVMKNDVPEFKIKNMLNTIESLKGVKNVAAYSKFVGPLIPETFVSQDLKDIFKKDDLQMIAINSECELASDAVNHQIDAIINLAKKLDKEAKVTGEAALTKDLSETVDSDIKITNFLSIAAIFIIVAIVFKSLTVPILLVSCIELAIFLNMSFPYLAMHEVPFVTPIVIGAIQLGATVDYSILLTTRFREELQNGHNPKDAIEIATETSSKSIITSVLVFLSANLGVIFISSLEIIKGICVTLARGSIISGLVILFILPPLLYLFEGVINKTSLNWRVAK